METKRLIRFDDLRFGDIFTVPHASEPNAIMSKLAPSPEAPRRALVLSGGFQGTERFWFNNFEVIPGTVIFTPYEN